MRSVISLLKNHRDEEAINLIIDDPSLLDEKSENGDTLGHLSVKLGSGRMLSFLVNFINEKFIDEEERVKKLSQIFETMNRHNYTPVDLAILKCQYNFLLFLIEHCCPNGYDLLVPYRFTFDYYGIVKNCCIKCFDFYMRNCPVRVSCFYLYQISTKKDQHRYLDNLIEKYETQRERVFNGLTKIFEAENRNPNLYSDLRIEKQNDIKSMIDENPRLAWDDFMVIYPMDGRNLAEFAAQFGFLDILRHIHETIMAQPYTEKSKNNLLNQTFQHDKRDYWQYQVSAYNRNVICALDRAVIREQFECVKFIMENCCPDGMVNAKYFCGTLILAAATNVEIFEYILLNIDGDIREYLKWKCPSFKTDVFYWDIFPPRYKNGNTYEGTPLDVARKYRRTDIIEYLENFDFEDFQRKKEQYSIQQYLQAIEESHDMNMETTLPELMLGVVRDEIEATRYRRRAARRFTEE